MTHITAKWQQYCDWAGMAGHRHLSVLSGERSWCREYCLEWLQENPGGTTLLLSDRTLGTLEPCEPRHILGTESDTVIIDAWAGLNLDRMAAAAGTLTAGGLLLIITPEWEDWLEQEGSRFVKRFCCLLADAKNISLIAHGQVLQEPDPVTEWTEPERLPTADQVKAMDAVIRVATGHRHRPLVMRADRGRGKSAALGLAAAQLCAGDYGDIILTGPRPQSVEVVFEHAQEEWPGSMRKGHALNRGGASLRYIPPDILLSDKPRARLLLVDEAAAIPPALLKQMLEHYPRVVFATTIHGYEGSGRGFDVRFRDTLDTLTPQWRSIHLQQPIRWQRDDPVEDFLNRLLLLDAEPADSEAVADGMDDYRIRPVTADELSLDEALLRQVFGLLISAHYQTSPEDLRLLLDLPQAYLYIAEADHRVLGAALILKEGELPQELQDAIDNGERRLRGHLLPQTFAYHCVASQALSMRMARVVRIAVHHGIRRCGLGSALLRHLEQQLEQDGFDLIGSSFAADSWVSAFWLQEEFSPLRLGTRRDSCSGSHALVVAKPLTPRCVELVEQLHQRFSRQFGVLLGEQFRDLEPDLAMLLFSACLTQPGPESRELEEVRRYANGVVTYETAAAALWYYVIQRLPGLPVALESGRECLIMKVLQRREWSDMVSRCAARGRADIDDRLRRAVRQLLADTEQAQQ